MSELGEEVGEIQSQGGAASSGLHLRSSPSDGQGALFPPGLSLLLAPGAGLPMPRGSRGSCFGPLNNDRALGSCPALKMAQGIGLSPGGQPDCETS